MKSKIDPLEYEEDYFQKKPLNAKQDQKKAQNNDRSKFKKSNLDQKLKQQQRQPLPKNLNTLSGRVITLSRQGYKVQIADSTIFVCSLKGSMKKEQGSAKNLVVVGDIVHFEKVSEDYGVITRVEKRKSELVRLDNLKRRQKQLIAANIDQVFITVSLMGPPLKPFLIDRYILAAIKSGIEPIVVVNKIDYLQERPSFVSDTQFEQDKENFEILKALESSYPFKLFFVSCETGENLDKLKKTMQGKTSVFAGQSGTGKSSLLNLLLAKNLDVGKIKEKTRKGSHTTSISSLIALDGGGHCIDTPGIKSFGIWDLSKQDVALAFPEFAPFSKECKFRACSHNLETGCAVKLAAEQGSIALIRHQSYIHLMQEENLPFWK